MRFAARAIIVLSIGCGIALIVISSVNLSTLKTFGDCSVNPNECTCESYFEGSFCKWKSIFYYLDDKNVPFLLGVRQYIYNALFITCGIAAIVINILPTLAVFIFFLAFAFHRC